MSDVALYLVEEPPESLDDWEPGMMWPLAVSGEGAGFAVVLSRYTDAAGVRWPTIWHTSQTAGGTPWQVTGTPPKITVRPSIAVGGYWHGFITDGVAREV